jgi:hypothetical protein
MLAASDPPTLELELDGDIPTVFMGSLGDEEMVVTVVVAVRGRSADPLEAPPPEDGNRLPCSTR